MERINIDSTMISTIGYDAANQRLEVDFNTGGVYCYQDVPQDVFDALMAADAIGEYIRDNIDPVFPAEPGACDG